MRSHLESQEIKKNEKLGKSVIRVASGLGIPLSGKAEKITTTL